MTETPSPQYCTYSVASLRDYFATKVADQESRTMGRANWERAYIAPDLPSNKRVLTLLTTWSQDGLKEITTDYPLSDGKHFILPTDEMHHGLEEQYKKGQIRPGPTR